MTESTQVRPTSSARGGSGSRTPSPTPIVVFADVSCPFAHVGLRRLVERRRQLGREDVRLRVLAWPLELINGGPLLGTNIEQKVLALRTQVAPDLFAAFEPDRFPATTLPALRLTSAAYRLDSELGESIALDLRDRLFEHGEDVADPHVLMATARRCGAPDLYVDPIHSTGPVEAEWALGRARHVVGSPHFVVRGRGLFCPSLSIGHSVGDLQIVVDHQRFDELAHLCFG
ncbi:MAG TPA: DsbA family protein [Microthrixaceae bacterium]|nr:DsbA family protein [Microthrixaceae bacterium]